MDSLVGAEDYEPPTLCSRVGKVIDIKDFSLPVVIYCHLPFVQRLEGLQ